MRLVPLVLLAVILAGCQSLGGPPASRQLRQEAAATPRRPQGPTGTLHLEITWPHREVQTIPASTSLLVVKVTGDAAVVLAESEVARPETETTTSVSLEVEATASAAVDVKAYRDAGREFLLAEGASTSVSIEPSARTDVDINLGPLYRPEITSISPAFGPIGMPVTITGQGLARDWAATASVTFNGAAAQVTRSSATSLTVLAPISTTGLIDVAVDGVATTSTDVFTYGARLHALSPAEGKKDDAIYVEGLLGDPAAVSLNGSTFPLEYLGPGRARFKVPAAFAGGTVAIEHAGSTSNKLILRRTATNRGIQSLVRAYPTLGRTSRGLASLTGARARAAGVVADFTDGYPQRYAFVAGGESSDGTILGSLERAAINGDGTLGPFATVSGRQLATAREDFTLLNVRGYLYAIGGKTAGGPSTSVERSGLVSADGSVASSFADAGVALRTARQAPSVQIVGNFVYVLGGGSTAVERAQIGTDGFTLGDFETVPGVTLKTSRSGACAQVIAAKLYVIGGADSGGNPLATVEAAQIAPDGSLGDFATNGSMTLTTARLGASATFSGSALYVFGGQDAAGAPVAGIERSAVDAGGTPAGFESGGSLTPARYGFVSLVTGDWLHLVGGIDASGTYLGRADAAPLLRDNTPWPAFSDGGANLNVARFGQSVLVEPAAACHFGGASTAGGAALDSIECRRLTPGRGPTGTLFATSDTLGSARRSHAAVTAGNYLYLVGGSDGTGALSSIERWTLSAGVHQSFGAAGRSLGTARSGACGVLIGSTFHVIGGAGLRSTEYTTLSADGSALGAFTDGPLLGEARAHHSCEVVGGYVYVFGGEDGGTARRGIERSPINDDGTLAGFSSAGDLATARTGHSTWVIGDQVYHVGGAAGDVERAQIGTGGDLGTFATVTGVAPDAARSGHASLLFDGAIWLLGGLDATDAWNTAVTARP